ncbi:porin family protein [Winogradskyella sp.]|uniref:porin family protein n=1 Tax=Winogradskyella sp. TaxID=1883156 RepID=UPI003BAD3FD5
MKNFLFSVVVLFSISNGLAQEVTEAKSKTYDFGVRIGYNNYTINSTGQNPSGHGYYGGLFLERSLSEKLALQIEINYNYSGSSTLQLPLLLKYRIADKFEIFSGPQLDFSFEQKTLNEESRNKRWGASLLFGVQYNINSHWFADMRYILGLTDQFPIFQGVNVESIYGKRRSFNIGLGYKF